MPLTPAGLSELVFADHLALFPLALNATRSNPARGVPLHVVPERFIHALCTAFVTSLKAMTIKDLGSGTADPLGVAPPTTFTFPAAPAAVAQLVATLGWTGPQAVGVASSYVGNVLLRASQLGLLQMRPLPVMGTGTGLVTPASNPGLLAAMTAELSTQLPLAFEGEGVFGDGDVPGAQVNAILAAQLPAYASALATGVASMTATVTYVGTAASPAPVSGVFNTGEVL